MVVARDESVLVVVVVQFEDVVASVEGPEEGDFQLPVARFSGLVGFSANVAPLFFAGVVAAVVDPNGVFIDLGVFGGDVLQAALETIVRAGDFVPESQVALDFEIFDGNDSLWSLSRERCQGERDSEEGGESRLAVHSVRLGSIRSNAWGWGSD